MKASEAVRSVVDHVTSATARLLGPFDSSTHTDISLKRLLGNLPGMVYRCRNEPDWPMEFVSRGCRSLTGFEPWDLLDRGSPRYGDLIHPEDRERVWREVQDAVRARRRFRLTYRLRRVDGSELWVWEQGSPVIDDFGEVVALEGFVTDITEREELAQRVADRERQLRAVVEQALVGIFVVSRGRFSYVNSRLADIFGYTVEEVHGMRSVLKLVHADDRRRVADSVRDAPEGAPAEQRYVFRGLRRDGSVCYVEVHGRRVDLPSGTVAIGAVLDVTEQRRAERRYHETQKMESLAHLATGVAHDFRNILSVVKMTAEFALSESPEGSSLENDLREIVAAADRGDELTRQLTMFGNPHPEPGTSGAFPSVAIGRLEPMLRRLVEPGISLELDVSPELPLVPLSRTQVEEVVMNLVLNARDATPAGGRVAVRVDRPPPGDESRRSGLDATDCVRLSVEDQGHGIEPEVQRKMFEPYFTTKGDKGTGLGLSNVRRIVREAGGTVELTSQLGVGSTFEVFLPVASTA